MFLNGSPPWENASWTLAIKYFFTVFYRGGDYYFFGTGGLGGVITIGISTPSLPGVLICPFDI